MQHTQKHYYLATRVKMGLISEDCRHTSNWPYIRRLPNQLSRRAMVLAIQRDKLSNKSS